MWMLNFLPDSWLITIVNTTLIISILVLLASTFLSHLPAMGNFAGPAKIIAIIILITAVYFKGSLNNELDWRARVAELEAKVQIAEEKSQQVNTVIEQRVITKTKVVRDTQIVVQEKIREVAATINEKCVIDPAVIEIHNQAAQTPGGAQ
jgi:hypothetical protein